MTSRVEAAIDAAKAAGRGAFVGYLPLGFPDLETSIEAAVTLAENGVDVLELGPPWSATCRPATRACRRASRRSGR